MIRAKGSAGWSDMVSEDLKAATDTVVWIVSISHASESAPKNGMKGGGRSVHIVTPVPTVGSVSTKILAGEEMGVLLKTSGTDAGHHTSKTPSYATPRAPVG